MANASRISASAAVAILRLSVSGWSVMSPSASETSSSASLTSSVMPSPATIDADVSAGAEAGGDEGSGAPLTPPDSMQQRDYGERRPGLGYGVALGLVATGSGLAAAEVVVGLVEGSASPVVPVGQEFIDHVPKGMKDWAIEQFGTNDKA